MKNKKYIRIGIGVFLLAALLFVVYHGRKATYVFKFEGEIVSVDDSSLEIKCDSLNDVGQRDQYIIKKNDRISVRNSAGEDIHFSSLAVGDHVEVLYTFSVARSEVEQYRLNDGAEIQNVQEIKVINNR